MDIIKQLNWRYATKKFDDKKILSQEKINILKQAFNLTATSFGLQTIKLLIIKSKDLRKPLLQHSYNQKQVIEASHLLIICVQNSIEDIDVNNYYDNIKSIRNTSDIILEPYRLDLIKMMKSKSLKEQQQWSKNQAYIALGNLMTICAIEGIDSCPMEGFIPEMYDTELKLKEKGLKSVLLLPVGYRAINDMFADLKKVRKPIEETVIEI